MRPLLIYRARADEGGNPCPHPRTLGGEGLVAGFIRHTPAGRLGFALAFFAIATVLSAFATALLGQMAVYACVWPCGESVVGAGWYGRTPKVSAFLACCV